MTTDAACVKLGECFYAGGIYRPLPPMANAVLWIATALIFGILTFWAIRANLRRMS